MGMLPRLQMGCIWLPVDVVAESIIQIAGLDSTHGGYHLTNEILRSTVSDEDNAISVKDASAQRQGQLVYNLVSPGSFSWTFDLLPALSAAGLSFRPVSTETWLHQLRRFSSMQPESGTDKPMITEAAADPEQNPAIKLVDFFEETFLTDEAKGDGGSSVVFETGEAQKMASTLREAPGVVESGLMKKMLEAWMQKWKGKM